MKFTHIDQLEKREKADLLVIPYWKGVHPYPAFSFNEKWPKVLEEALATKDFQGKEGEILFLYVEGQVESRFCLLGLGAKEKSSIESFRRSFGALTKACLSKRLKKMNLLVPESDVINGEELIQGVAEGLLLPNYLFNRHKHREADEPAESLIQSVTWISSHLSVLEKSKKIHTICQAIYYARDLINENADIVTPQYLAGCAKELEEHHASIKTTILDKQAIEKEKLGLLLAVNRGSALDPAFIIVEYQGNPHHKDKTVVVGKGVTYDTGGLHLKPLGGMETMKCDMSGAAVCLGLVKVVSQLKLKVNLTVVIPSTENGIDARSFKPGDIYESYSGKSVEMMNSDAEGRLILADGLAYAAKNLQPTRIIDIATLTGAIDIALGSEAAGLMSTDDNLADALIQAGKTTFERLWRMPLFDEYKEKLKSDFADFKNWNGRSAGALVAAVFMRQFVPESIPWAHIDIASTAYLSEPKKYLPKNATGFGIRLLLSFLERLAID